MADSFTNLITITTKACQVRVSLMSNINDNINGKIYEKLSLRVDDIEKSRLAIKL